MLSALHNINKVSLTHETSTIMFPNYLHVRTTSHEFNIKGDSNLDVLSRLWCWTQNGPRNVIFRSITNQTLVGAQRRKPVPKDDFWAKVLDEDFPLPLYFTCTWTCLDAYKGRAMQIRICAPSAWESLVKLVRQMGIATVINSANT